ncbi:MAG TPA: tripartite tricarboxylate transporter substrate binding protein [Roseococcus sp.]|jgi:tripartite-type tricarboxylate transporter receptor subunit TctC|nr:tripartite tricarboxylate transporter substrate binding protein [Roseococcus sp.]
MRRRSLLPVLAATALPFGAAAQPAWVPDRPVRLIAPFAAGGAADILARIVAEDLSPLLGQQVVVENRTGAGGAVGTESVARARPDGLTLLMASQATHGIVPNIARLSFDPATDTVPVANLAGVPAVLVVNRDLPITNFAEFAAYIRARSGQLSYGSAGIGSSTHMTMALLLHMAGLDVTHVPYRGTALAMPDLLAGRIIGMTDTITSALSAIRDGRVRAIGVSSPAPLPVLPGVPPLGADVPGYEVLNWYGLAGPRGLPANIVTTLHAHMQTLLDRPAFLERLASQGAQPLPMSPEAFGTYIARDRQQWADLVRATGMTVQ